MLSISKKKFIYGMVNSIREAKDYLGHLAKEGLDLVIKSLFPRHKFRLQRKSFSMIVACNYHGYIGHEGKVPWYCKCDLTWFAKVTKEFKYCLVGSKTYHSLPPKVKADPDRIFYVMSRSPMDVGDLYFKNRHITNVEDVPDGAMVIGGAEIYKLAMPFVDEIYITHVKKDLKEYDTHLGVSLDNFKRKVCFYIDDQVFVEILHRIEE